MISFRVRAVLHAASLLAACAFVGAQQLRPQGPASQEWVRIKPIEPPAVPLPAEEATAGVTRFSFIGYGDTRSGAEPGGDGVALHPEHGKIVDRMIATAQELSATPFPVRFVLQSGDAVLRGQNGAMWNVSFSPIVERLTR